MSVLVTVDPLRSLAAASISASYANVGTAFAFPMRLIKIVNNTDGDLTVSYNGGASDQDFVTKNSFVLYDICSNHDLDGYWFMGVGTQVSVKGTPSSGSVYVIAMYGA